MNAFPKNKYANLQYFRGFEITIEPCFVFISTKSFLTGAFFFFFLLTYTYFRNKHSGIYS